MNEKQKIYAEILNSFCGKDNLRPIMKTPTLCEGNVCATDAHRVAIINRNLLGNDYVLLEKEGNFDEQLSRVIIKPTCEIKYSMESIDEEVKKLPIIPCYDTVAEEKECSLCGGFGEVTWTAGDDSNYEKEDTCPKCEGDGNEQKERKELNGKSEIDPESIIIIKGFFIRYSIFESLLNAAKLLNVKEIKLTNCEKASKGILFKVENIEVIIMPITTKGDNKSVELTP